MNKDINPNIREIYDIGQEVDYLQDLYSNAKALVPNVVQTIKVLEIYFNKPIMYNEDSDYMAIYFYTKANYLTVLLGIARAQFDETKETVESFQKYVSYEELRFELIISRLTLMRASTASYAQNDNTLISKQWIAQVHINLSNLYLESGRILESLNELEDVKFEIGMALGNYGGKLYELAQHTLDDSKQKELLVDAFNHFRLATSHNGENDDSIYPSAFDGFCAAKSYIQKLLESDRYREIPIYTDIPDNDLEDVGIEDNSYRRWCRDNRLALSIRNTVGKHSNTDDVHLPNLGISYFSKDDTLSYYSWFNTTKQEFNMARYLLFKLEIKKCETDETHLSQQDILLINTLDYPAIGYRTETLKLSLKTAYGVLDKIGLLCSDFVGGTHNEVSRISFTSWFKGLDKEIALHSEFSSLYWLAQDLDFKNGSFKTFRKLRNVVEHRFLRVLDDVGTSIEAELEDNNKVEYKISYSDLYEHTLKVIKLVRHAIIYLVFAFNDCYTASMIDAKNADKVFIPLHLDIYEDEWKIDKSDFYGYFCFWIVILPAFLHWTALNTSLEIIASGDCCKTNCCTIPLFFSCLCVKKSST